jgi:3-carboxy-cis,cis-muconate cycloisomerase
MIGPFLAALAGDAEIEALFGDDAAIAAMLDFEWALAEATAEAGLIAPEAAAAIAAATVGFTADRAGLAAGMRRDGVVGPAFVAQFRAAVALPHRAAVHFGATSQDLVDTAQALALGRLCAVLDGRLAAILAALAALKAAQGTLPLMAHTRMQAALPFTVGDKLDTWTRPLERLRARLDEERGRVATVQLGGPVGTRTAYGAGAAAISAGLARRLGLADAEPWHGARERLAGFGGCLALVAGALGKIGADVALLAQSEVGAIRLAGGGTSSAMAHKANPVAAEVLVALARHAAGLAGTLMQAMVHENERSGAAWTLEWLTLPALAVTTGAALAHAERLVPAVTFVGGAD